MNVPSLVKIPWYLLKLSSRNQNMSWADNSVKIWRNLPISDSKPDLHNINAHTKFGENPLMFAQVIIQKQNMDGRTYDWQTDGWTDTRTSNVKPLYPTTIMWRGIKRENWDYWQAFCYYDSSKHSQCYWMLNKKDFQKTRKGNKNKQNFHANVNCFTDQWIKNHIPSPPPQSQTDDLYARCTKKGYLTKNHIQTGKQCRANYTHTHTHTHIYICVRRKVRIGTIPFQNCLAQSKNSYFVRQFWNCTGQF